MTPPAAITLPPDALEKAGAANRDYYSNLTDEERESEGLPPREQPKADPEPEPAPEPEPEPQAAEAESGDSEEAVSALYEQLEALNANQVELRNDLAELVGKKAPTTEAAEDRLLKMALEHEDPTVRELAAEIKARSDEQTERLEAVEKALQEQKTKAQFDSDEADRADLLQNMLIGGKPMTEEHMDRVDDYFKSVPKVVAQLLTFEEATRRVFPSATRAVKPAVPAKPAASRPAKATGTDGPAATIVDGGSSGGAPAGPWKPRANETIDSAVAAAGARLFGVKR